MKLKYGQDPDIYISELEDLVTQYRDAGGRWDEEETLEHICGNLPKCYDATIAPLEKRIGDSNNPLDLEELRQDLSLKYLKLNPKSVDEDVEEGEEIGLFAGGFKGKCFKCGKQGHRARDCRSNNQGNGSNNQGNGGNRVETRTCYHCKEKGHIALNCPKLKAKKQREQAMSAIDREDVLLSCLICEDNQENDKSSEIESSQSETNRDSESIFENENEVALTAMDEISELALKSVDIRKESKTREQPTRR